MPETLDPYTEMLARERADRRRLRRWIAAMAALHIAALWTALPRDVDARPKAPARAAPMPLTDVRIKPPAPPPEPTSPEPPRPERPTITVPDPEPPVVPVRVDPLPLPEPLPLDVAPAPVAIPALPAPPAPPAVVEPVRIGGAVRPPVRTVFVEPRYTEPARRARIQGTVILDTVIDPRGRVVDVSVLEGLPLGLTEAAVAAVSQWRFEPTELDGRPVPVAYVVTIRFAVR